MSQVILVNDKDEELGQIDKMTAHQEGLMHRAFSVFILNEKGEMLLQKRAIEKYHSGGLWTNTCCSHPSPGQNTLSSAQVRLLAEMGFTCPIHHAFSFTYKTSFDNGLIENEFDHVFIGFYDGSIIPDKNEVEEFAWMSLIKIREKIAIEPALFTEWFKIALPKVEEYLNLNTNLKI